MHEAIPHTIFGWPTLAVATTIFVLSYAVIIVDKINRAIVALLGAIAGRWARRSHTRAGYPRN